MITIQLKKDTVSPQLLQLAKQAKNPRAIFAAIGRSVVNLFRRHLRELDRTHPNKMGGQRQHFWLALSRSTNQSSISPTGTTISISDPRAAHKHFGGVITAKNAKFLTIPVKPEAYGRTARTFTAETGIKLFVWNGKLMGQVPGEGHGVTVYYILKSSVKQGPDPAEGILPPEDQIKAVTLQTAQSVFARQMKLGGPTT